MPPELPQDPQQGQTTPRETVRLGPVSEPVAEPIAPPVVEFRVRVREAAKTQMDMVLPGESVLGRFRGPIALFPRAPYDKDEKTGAVTQPTFVLGTEQNQNRRVADVSSRFAYSDKAASFVSSEQTSLAPKELVLVPLPLPTERVVLTTGMRADGTTSHSPLTLFQDKGQYFLRDQDGGISPLPSDFSVSTHELNMREKVYVSPPERQGEIAESDVLVKQDKTVMNAKVVVADGIPSLLVEGAMGGSVVVGRQALDHLHSFYETRATKTEQFKGGFLLSVPSKRHPLRNEDAVFRTPDGIHVVLDGMGSYQSNGVHTGYEHSRLAQAVILESLAARGQQKEPSHQLEAFIGALVDAHEVLKRNMTVAGDTTVALSRIMSDRKKGPVLVWANIGDSRVMVVRNGQVIQVSEDDSVLEDYYHGKGMDTWISVGDKTQAMQLFEAGFPYDETSGKVFFSRKQVDLMRSILDRFHGFGMFATDSFLGQFFRQSSVTKGLKEHMNNSKTDVHSGIFQLERGDMVLTMSDGVSDPLSIEDMEMIARRVGRDPQKLATEMLVQVDKTNATPSEYSQRGKEDDKSLVVEVVS
ncbi:MAG TPA: protein phosphatase 2C domain-containing protein [Patescibacteria group bacterium]|nr:protein phosphatase 2C domain-containing protein [Patescibacteria group bacterium]